jgi:hypothetical protein
LTANVTRYLPILIPESKTYDRIGFRTAGSFSGTGIARIGIYNNLNGRPDTVLLDAGTVSHTAADTNYEITISQTLGAGFYWLAFNVTTQAATESINGTIANSATFGHMYNSSSLNFGSPAIGFHESVNATSGFSTAVTLTGSSSDFAIVGIRAV